MQRFGYKLLSQNQINERLLDKAYMDTKDKVETILKKSLLLNIISNKSNNMKYKQILNTTLFIKNYCIFYTFSESVKDKHLDAAKNAY